MSTKERVRGNTGPVIQKEIETVTRMIEFYCTKKHKTTELCQECLAIETYAHKRLRYCQFDEEKTACSNCPIHCYKPDKKEEIKTVMRYSGPRMLFFHPFYSFRHLRWTREKKK